jgi:hypothetical protein
MNFVVLGMVIFQNNMLGNPQAMKSWTTLMMPAARLPLGGV